MPDELTCELIAAGLNRSSYLNVPARSPADSLVSDNAPGELLTLALESKTRLRRMIPLDRVQQIFRNRRSMFETMARSAAREPDVPHCRVPVDQEVPARRVFVMANLRAAEHRRPHRRK